MSVFGVKRISECFDDDKSKRARAEKKGAEVVGEGSGESKGSPQPQAEGKVDEDGSKERDERMPYALRVLGLSKPRSLDELIENGIKISDAGLNVDPLFYLRIDGDGELVDEELAKEYVRQVDESDGFDVSAYPGPIPLAEIIPVCFEEDPEEHDRLIYLSKLALNQFNKDNIDAKGTPYEFVNIEKATVHGCTGYIYRITFRARQTDAADLRTFRAKVYDDCIDEFEEVEFIRMI